MQVVAGGGTPAPLTTVDDTRGEFTHAAPWFLPDGRHFLYLCASLASGTGGTYIGRVGLEPVAQEPTRLLATECPAVYARSRDSSTGRLFFMQGSREPTQSPIAASSTPPVSGHIRPAFPGRCPRPVRAITITESSSSPASRSAEILDWWVPA